MPEPELILIDEWVGCYRGGWKGVICDEAFSHPAKIAFNLAKKIYEHAIEEGWIASGDTVVDCFGGIGGCAFHGLMNGMIVVTNELEEKFVNLSKENRELWRKQYTGLPGFNADNWIILQGDSRHLSAVIRETGLSVSSPPYADGCAHTGGDDPKPENVKGGNYHGVGIHLGVSSPPYSTETVNDRNGIDLSKIKKPGGHNSQSRKMSNYGSEDGQLGRMAVSSPPFPQPYSSGGGINKNGYGDGSDKVGDRTYQSQGGDRAEGNLETLEIGSVDMAITSPPYNPPMSQDHNGSRGGKRGTEPNETEGQIGTMPVDTFWSASRTILEQLYSVLTPSAHAIFITKRFVRDKQIVEFTDQWIMLCEAVGFRLLHRHKAMLTESHGAQHTLTGETDERIVERKSFFRRLAEKKGSPRIDWEDVTCFVKSA